MTLDVQNHLTENVIQNNIGEHVRTGTFSSRCKTSLFISGICDISQFYEDIVFAKETQI